MSRVADDALALRQDSGTCRGCGARQVLCAFGQCPRCHASGRPTARGWLSEVDDQPGHLCCGWWGPLSVLPWTCLTCGAVRGRHGRERR